MLENHYTNEFKFKLPIIGKHIGISWNYKDIPN